MTNKSAAERVDCQTPVSAEHFKRLSQLAELLMVLIRIHDREVGRVFLSGLKTHDVPGWIGETLAGEQAEAALTLLSGALDEVLADGPADSTSDRTIAYLAAEYADLYLTHGYRVSPNGSVWLTEDRLERQDPMFEVRDWYAHYDITVPNWRVRADDHLVHELQFVAFLAEQGHEAAAQDLARFLDLHVLPWIPAFCHKAVTRVREPFYQAALLLTDAVLEALRSALEAATGSERNVREPAKTEAERGDIPDETVYIPGVAPSW